MNPIIATMNWTYTIHSQESSTRRTMQFQTLLDLFGKHISIRRRNWSIYVFTSSSTRWGRNPRCIYIFWEIVEVMMFTGWILPTDDINMVGNANPIMKDLSQKTFCVSLVDRNSIIAFSVVNDMYWNDKSAHPAGVEKCLRQTLKEVFVIKDYETSINL